MVFFSELHIAHPFLSVISYVHPAFSSHFPTPFPDIFVLSGVYRFFLLSAINLHFFFGVFLHFIIGADTSGISSMSRMRRPHLGFGHFTFSIDHRLPALIFNKGTSLSLPVPFYRLCFIGFLPASRFPYLPESLPCPPYGILPTHYSLNACQAPLCIHQTCISYPPPQSGTLPSSLLCRSPLSYQKRTFSCSGCSAPAYQPTA